MAFKLYLYQGLWQLFWEKESIGSSCEWLSNCIFIRVFDNSLQKFRFILLVVNGFQIVSLSGSLTTKDILNKHRHQLWMAFKLYLYQGLWQQTVNSGVGIACCEWLSNCIFIRVFDNLVSDEGKAFRVVNGFQIVSLSGSLTTKIKKSWNSALLWMAFKLYLYQGLWQQLWVQRFISPGCEWLSNCIFIRVFDNRAWKWSWWNCVVNGFQIVSLSGSLTTNIGSAFTAILLWMAFKLYLYQGLWQPGYFRYGFRTCCEWLSNCIFIRVFDNDQLTAEDREAVVNGFQIVSLSGSLTTPFTPRNLVFWLWMAFKLYLYQGLWQQIPRHIKWFGCCEWLSNCIFIRVFDNKSPSL